MIPKVSKSRIKHTCKKCAKSVFLQNVHKKIKCLWCDGTMVPKEKK